MELTYTTAVAYRKYKATTSLDKTSSSRTEGDSTVCTTVVLHLDNGGSLTMPLPIITELSKIQYYPLYPVAKDFVNNITALYRG